MKKIRGLHLKSPRKNYIHRITQTDYYMGMFFLIITVFTFFLISLRLIVKM